MMASNTPTGQVLPQQDFDFTHFERLEEEDLIPPGGSPERRVIDRSGLSEITLHLPAGDSTSPCSVIPSISKGNRHRLCGSTTHRIRARAPMLKRNGATVGLH